MLNNIIIVAIILFFLYVIYVSSNQNEPFCSYTEVFQEKAKELEIPMTSNAYFFKKNQIIDCISIVTNLLQTFEIYYTIDRYGRLVIDKNDICKFNETITILNNLGYNVVHQYDKNKILIKQKYCQECKTYDSSNFVCNACSFNNLVIVVV